MDSSARAIAEMVGSDVSPLHLLHPRPVSWASIMEPLAKVLGLGIVPFEEWVNRLEKSGEDLTADKEVEVMRQNPALKIIGTFIRAKLAPPMCREAMGIPHLDSTQAQRVSSSLAPERLPELTVSDALRWVEYWKSIGFL